VVAGRLDDGRHPLPRARVQPETGDEDDLHAPTVLRPGDIPEVLRETRPTRLPVGARARAACMAGAAGRRMAGGGWGEEVLVRGGARSV
jgi:hypothetical protein